METRTKSDPAIRREVNRRLCDVRTVHEFADMTTLLLRDLLERRISRRTAAAVLNSATGGLMHEGIAPLDAFVLTACRC